VIQSFHSDCMNDFCCMVICVVRRERAQNPGPNMAASARVIYDSVISVTRAGV
jgi:succinate dehydrogenase/fumarate reductase-like Fe-S protein